MKKNLSYYFILGLKGMAMGAADVVPGVSGGTIAFISGIYEELITTISNLNLGLLKTLRTEGFGSMWRKANATFLLVLLLGIAFSVLSLVHYVRWLLENEPVLLWSFFFGLVVASIYMVGKEIGDYGWRTWLFLLLGTILAFWITSIPPLADSDNLWYLFICAAIAICAMILPGISGAFVLVILGAYEAVIKAVDDKNITVIAVVATGGLLGLLSFSKLLKWAYRRYRIITLASLTGFVAGSLLKIWPWKEVLSTRWNDEGVKVPLVTKNVWPKDYSGDPQLWLSIGLMFLGLILVLVLEKWANQYSDATV